MSKITYKNKEEGLNIATTEVIHDVDPAKSSIEGLGDLDPTPKNNNKNNKGYRSTSSGPKKIDK